MATRPKRISRRTIVNTMIRYLFLKLATHSVIVGRTLTIRSFVSIATDAGKVFDMVRKPGAIATMMTLT